MTRILEVEKGRYLYKWGSSRYYNWCEIFKLELIGVQPLIVKWKLELIGVQPLIVNCVESPFLDPYLSIVE